MRERANDTRDAAAGWVGSKCGCGKDSLTRRRRGTAGAWRAPAPASARLSRAPAPGDQSAAQQRFLVRQTSLAAADQCGEQIIRGHREGQMVQIGTFAAGKTADLLQLLEAGASEPQLFQAHG